MSILIDQYQIKGTPPPWSVTSVNNFVIGILNRALREKGDPPEQFWLSVCPWGERNALGGTPIQLQEVMDPRFRLVHFTGCGRPYLVILFIGEDAESRQQAAMPHLPWSEHFLVTCRDGLATLKYLSYTENVEVEQEPKARTLWELLHHGDLTHF